MPKAIFYLLRGTIGFRVFRVKGLGFRGLGRIGQGTYAHGCASNRPY